MTRFWKVCQLRHSVSTLLYMADIPEPKGTLVVTFADDTALLASHEEYHTAMMRLQKALTAINTWPRWWKIQLNIGKTVRIDYTLRPATYEPVSIGGTDIQKKESARYLGIHLDDKLNWRSHISKKREELKLQFRALHWMLRAKSQLSLNNKRLLYLMLLRPIWTYGAPLWGSAAASNIEILQRFQNLVLRKITGAPWFITNRQLHEDLRIETFTDVISKIT